MKCCDMTPGMLRTPVAVQTLTRTADGAGGFTQSWATTFTAQAHVTQTSGGERVEHDRLNAIESLRVVIRYRSGITPENRLSIDGVLYNIRRVNDVEMRKRWLEITAEGGATT